jgi:hypothetical protein
MAAGSGTGCTLTCSAGTTSKSLVVTFVQSEPDATFPDTVLSHVVTTLLLSRTPSLPYG